MDPNNNNSDNQNGISGTAIPEPSVPAGSPSTPTGPVPEATTNPPISTNSTPADNTNSVTGPTPTVAPPAAPAAIPNPVISPEPAPKIVNETAKPKVFVSTGSHKKAFILGALAIFLLVGLGASLYLVRQQQDIRSKASAGTCDMRWPADPATDCGKTTQLPKQDATDVPLTPDFHWDYGGYRTGETGCFEPSGCSNYSVTVNLMESQDGQPFASCYGQTKSTLDKDALFTCFQTCSYTWQGSATTTCHTDGQPKIAPLKPNTDYWWFVQPYFGGTVHAEQTWKYHFKTGSTNAACQMVTPDKDLTKIKVGDTVKFTGYGSISSPTESIDKINFIFTKDGATVAGGDTTWDAVRATDKDSDTNLYYVATQSAKITAPGSYQMRIRVHWKSADKWFE